MGKQPFNQEDSVYGDPEAAAQYDKGICDAWLNQLNRWAGRTSDLNILELGPGITLGPQVFLAGLGNRVTVVDPFAPRWSDRFHPAAYRHLASLVGGSTALTQAAECQSFVDVGVRQVLDAAEDLSSLDNQEFDVVLSNAVMEHVRDLDKVCSELARVTRIGGLNCHQIDLAYHKLRERPLDHLLMSDDEFLAEANDNLFEYGNRWRASEFRQRWRRAGFEVIHETITQKAVPEYVMQVRDQSKRERRAYGYWPVEDLGGLSVFFVIRRPRARAALTSSLKGSMALAGHKWRKLRATALI